MQARVWGWSPRRAVRTAGVPALPVALAVLVVAVMAGGSQAAPRTAMAGVLFSQQVVADVLTLQLVVNVMTLAGVPPLWNQFLNGAIIIVALIISRFASGEKQE